MNIPTRRSTWLAVLLASLLLTIAPGLSAQARPASAPFPEGSSAVQVDFDGTVLTLWAFKPENYVGDGFILLLHGASRAAEGYRDNARGFARKYGRLVIVPEFDAERFPNWRYQMGGVFRPDGTFVDPAGQTFAFVPRIVDYTRASEREPELPWILLGYSAGAQFVARMAAFYDLDAERLIAMAPGSALFPTREMEYGLGFGGLPAQYATDERIRRYLALPLTVSIGTADVEEGQLPSGTAFDQGVHRYARNLRWFLTAMELARERDWEFGWRLVLHHGAGHPPPEMFDHPAIGNSLFGHRFEPQPATRAASVPRLIPQARRALTADLGSR
jgi:pimeloyl-ACP methyl ester carboxylesterase